MILKLAVIVTLSWWTIFISYKSNIYCGAVDIKLKELVVDKLLASMSQSLMRYLHTFALFALNINYCFVI